MSKYHQFSFDSYQFDPTNHSLELHYSIDDVWHFVEKYNFNFNFAEYDNLALDRALQCLFFIAGASYYKIFIPEKIVVKAGLIDSAMAEFLSKTYQKGLGEFWYVNNMDPNTPVHFPVTTNQTLNTLSVSNEGLLIAVGGGKDSLLSIELLRDKFPDISTWSLNHQKKLAPLIDRIGLPHYFVNREWDKQLIALKDNPEAYNGHTPISAIFAAVGIVLAVLVGKKDVVMSNEASADEPTLSYQGVDINHQYSKSSQFEQDFQDLLQRNFDEHLRYYSLLRPFSELRISELFSTLTFDKYHDVFKSCNKSFRQGAPGLEWCGKCSKCAFVFLALTPFIDRPKLEQVFKGKNLLLDPSLEITYKNLLGIEGEKPLECIGEIKESRAAMRAAQQIYPELNKYEFELPIDYDWRSLAPHQMPLEIFDIVQKQTTL
jgi:hypothetical protein